MQMWASRRISRQPWRASERVSARRAARPLLHPSRIHRYGTRICCLVALLKQRSAHTSTRPHTAGTSPSARHGSILVSGCHWPPGGVAPSAGARQRPATQAATPTVRLGSGRGGGAGSGDPFARARRHVLGRQVPRQVPVVCARARGACAAHEGRAEEEIGIGKIHAQGRGRQGNQRQGGR